MLQLKGTKKVRWLKWPDNTSKASAVTHRLPEYKSSRCADGISCLTLSKNILRPPFTCSLCVSKILTKNTLLLTQTSAFNKIGSIISLHLQGLTCVQMQRNEFTFHTPKKPREVLTQARVGKSHSFKVWWGQYSAVISASACTVLFPDIRISTGKLP